MKAFALLLLVACGPSHLTADVGDECACRPYLGAVTCSPEDRPLRCEERFPCDRDAGCGVSLCFGAGCCLWKELR